MKKFVPIYKKIAGALQADIANETYPIGAQLPTEHDLMTQLGVSRSTVIAALDQLQQQGLVFRRPRAGTRVISRFPMRSEVEGVVLNDWAKYGVEYTFQINEIHHSSLPEIANYSGDGAGGDWLHLRGQRIDNKTKEILCTVDLYVNPEFASIEDMITEFPPRIYTLIEKRYGTQVSVIDQAIRATMLDESRARVLDALPNTPCIQVIRWFSGENGKLVEFTLDTHPGDRFKYKTRTHRGTV